MSPANTANNLLNTVKDFSTDFILHWKTPAKGNYVSYKEIAGYSIGNFGQWLAKALVGKFALDTANVVIGQTLGVEPNHIMIMNVINTFICFWFTMYRSNVIDNSRNREGRFRPFIKRYGIPTVLLAFALVWFPYDRLPDGGLTGTGYLMKCVIVLLFFLGIQFCMPFYDAGFGNLVMVISPNSQERTAVYSVVSVAMSLAPTIYNPILTAISDKLPNRSADLELYRWAFFPICIVGLALSYVAFYATKERIIQSRAHINKISLSRAFREIIRNKNFWVLLLAGWVGFLESASGQIFDWSFTYQESMPWETKAVVDAIIGNAGLWAILFAPLLTKYIGKRRIMIWSNVLQIAMLALTYNTYNIIFMLSVFRFVNFFMGILQDTIRPAIDADIRDEQHYRTGERIDGMFGLAGYSSTLISMGTGFVLPALQRKAGIHSDNGAVDNYGNPNIWWALRDVATFDKMCRTMIIASVIGATANVIPMFFYDLTEQKQRGMSRVLKIRAMLEDYSNGLATPEQISEGVDIVRQARADQTAQPVEITKNMTRKERYEARIRNEDISVCHYVIDELKKFDTPEYKLRMNISKKIVDAGFDGLYNYSPIALPEEPKMAKIVKEYNKELKLAAKHITKKYPERNIIAPDPAAMEALYDSPEETTEQARAKTAAIRAMENERSRFIDSAKPWLDAKRLLAECENQEHWDAIFEGYEDARRQAEENERLAAETARLELERKRAETERLRLQRIAEKEQKKAGKS
ncbi:MAG: MFS transporter [Oscillospiraceae bacterium]|nr:MFS transporter [Oscillospiraceae bacterium]